MSHKRFDKIANALAYYGIEKRLEMIIYHWVHIQKNFLRYVLRKLKIVSQYVE